MLVNKGWVAIGIALGLAVGTVGTAWAGDTEDNRLMEKILDGFSKTQPIPRRGFSQVRQNLIEIEEAQMDATATTSFFFGRDGGTTPKTSCPSIGFPIPSTYQLSNPWKKYDGPGEGGAVSIGQLEPNGVYTGDSSATYVMCVDPSGKAYAVYWEGDVFATTARSAKWDGSQIVMGGGSSKSFTTAKK